MYSALLSAAYSFRRAGSLLKDLSRTQWLTSKEIRAIQLKKLRELLEHCRRTVPHYHRIMEETGFRPEDVRTLDDLHRLPPVEKAEITKAPALFRSNSMFKGVSAESTSGSTGEPFTFLRSRSTYEWELAASLRFNEWTGYRLGDRWASIRRIRRLGSLWNQFATTAKDVLWRRMRVDDIDFTSQALSRGAERIVAFKPFLVRGFPKSLLEFGRHAQKASVPALVSFGENIAPFERRLMANRWGGEVYDRYGSTEARSVSSECGEHRGLHVADELYLLEFVRNGQHVSPGERGRILLTSLYHRAQPFVRYDTGDLSSPMEEECRCGRGLSLMSRVEGRLYDVIETEDGKLVYGGYDRWFGEVEVRQYQIEQRDRLKTIVRVVPDEGYTEESGETIAARARAVLGTNVDIEVRLMDAIPDYQSGKRQLVKSRLRFPVVT